MHTPHYCVFIKYDDPINYSSLTSCLRLVFIGHHKINVCLFHLFTVPDDVFAQNYIWKGSYNFKGRKQPMTLTVTSFNASTGRVNATLSNSNMELLLSGITLRATNNAFILIIFVNDFYTVKYSLLFYDIIHSKTGFLFCVFCLFLD